MLAQAHGPTRQLLWPTPWQDLYLEYTPGYQRLDSETSDHWLTNLVNVSQSAQCTWHDTTTAFVTMTTMDNLYHALIHFVPTREFFMRQQPALRGRPVHLLPHYVQYWPGSIARTVGWQMLVLSLGMSTSEWPAIAELAQTLTNKGACNCYRRMFGGHAEYMPPPYMKPARRMADFRGALADSLHTQPPARRLLFQVRRNGIRQIVNEVELRAGVEADPLLREVVHFAVMETLPVTQQYALVSSARSLAGVHGMGLAWTALLPSDESSTSSCLEIVGTWRQFSRIDYDSLSRANGVHFMRLSQPNAPECGELCRGRWCSYRTCGNITANVTQVSARLRAMVARMDGG
jgi:hypothetical protein